MVAKFSSRYFLTTITRHRPCTGTIILLRHLSSTVGARALLPTKRMNLFTAVNDAMRVALQTDPSAIVLGEGIIVLLWELLKYDGLDVKLCMHVWMSSYPCIYECQAMYGCQAMHVCMDVKLCMYVWMSSYPCMYGCQAMHVCMDVKLCMYVWMSSYVNIIKLLILLFLIKRCRFRRSLPLHCR